MKNTPQDKYWFITIPALFAGIVMYSLITEHPTYPTLCNAIETVFCDRVILFPSLGMMLISASMSLPAVLMMGKRLKAASDKPDRFLTLIKALIIIYFSLIVVAALSISVISSSYAVVLFTAAALHYMPHIPVTFSMMLWHGVIIALTGVSLLLPILGIIARKLNWRSYVYTLALLAILFGFAGTVIELGGSTPNCFSDRLVYTDPCK